MPPDVRTGDRAVSRAAWLARLLDQLLIDPILGLVAPGAGDVLSGAMGLYIIAVAIQRRLPKIVISRMVLNLAVDALVGAIPIAGDVFDFFFKANQRNLALLQTRHVTHKAALGDWMIVAAAALLAVAAVLLPIFVTVRILQWIF